MPTADSRQPPFRIVPVLDLLGGAVVRGVGGRRDEYRPVRSVLVDSAEPGAVAAAFAGRQFAAEQGVAPCLDGYVADLDAIRGGATDLASLRAIAATGLRVWLDAGLADLPLPWGDADDGLVHAAIVGAESVFDEAALARLLRRLDDRAVFSLDLRGGVPLVRAEAWRGLAPLRLAERVVELGCRRLIVLDLLAVGERQGPVTLDLCRELRRRWPDLELVSGGGVRTSQDLERFRDSGCDAVLVATALHDGTLS